VVKTPTSICFTLTETAVNWWTVVPLHSAFEVKAIFQKSGRYVSRTTTSSHIQLATSSHFSFKQRRVPDINSETKSTDYYYYNDYDYDHDHHHPPPPPRPRPRPPPSPPPSPPLHHFFFAFNWPIFLENIPGYAKEPLGLPSQDFYWLYAIPVTQPTVSKYWKKNKIGKYKVKTKQFEKLRPTATLLRILQLFMLTLGLNKMWAWRHNMPAPSPL